MKNNRHVIIYVLTLLAISIAIGYIYGINNYYDLSDYIKNLSTNNNLYVNHLISMAIVFFTTMSLLGMVSASILIGMEGISIGYIIALFYSNFKFKGILYGIITVLLNKAFYLILMGYLLFVCYKYIKNIIRNIVGIKQESFSSLFIPLLKKYVLVISFLITYDTFIYFFGNKLLNNLTFML